MLTKVDLSEEKKVVFNIPAKGLSGKHHVSFKDKEAVYMKRKRNNLSFRFSIHR